MKMFSAKDSKQAIRMILSCVTSCMGHELWKLSVATFHNWKLLLTSPQKPLCFNKIRTTTTDSVFNFQHSSSESLQPYYSIWFSIFCTHSSQFSGLLNRSVSVWYSNTLWPLNRSWYSAVCKQQLNWNFLECVCVVHGQYMWFAKSLLISIYQKW